MIYIQIPHTAIYDHRRICFTRPKKDQSILEFKVLRGENHC